MRVLLVNTNRERAPQPVIPLGLCLIASATEAAGHQVKVLDLCFARHPDQELVTTIKEFSPQAIGLSIRNLDNGEYSGPVSYLPFAARMAQLCHEHSAVPLIIGGPAVSVAPAEVRTLLEADYAVGGEGEQVFPQLLGRIDAHQAVDDLTGVYTPTTAAEVAAQVGDLRDLPPSQAGRWLDLGRYLRWGSTMSLQSKRGCALRCIYCTYQLIEGCRYRLRSPEIVMEELREAYHCWGVRRFEFVDSTFNHPPRHALELCEAISRAGLAAEMYTMGFNPAGASRELLQLMKRARFNAMLCSPDSGSDTMLHNLCKGFSADQVAQTAAYAQEAGVSVLWSFMFGGPGETEGTVRETVALIDSALGPRDRMLCTVGLRVYPHTELEQIARAAGVVAPDDDLLKPKFYLSPQISEGRILELLDSSRRRSQMMRLGALQQPCIPLALRAKTALQLPGSPWIAIPLYNLMRRWFKFGK